MRPFLSCVLAYAASKAAFALSGFQIRPNLDPFHAGKLAIDIGVFVAFFYGFNWLLGRLSPFRPKDGA
jgi:hypothetical protein